MSVYSFQSDFDTFMISRSPKQTNDIRYVFLTYPKFICAKIEQMNRILRLDSSNMQIYSSAGARLLIISKFEQVESHLQT
jgi:hypothetical protein